LQAEGRFPVRADPVRIGQVLTNLVANAVKFTPRDGHVTVRLANEGQQVRIDVADEGRGLEPAEIARLFQPFTQVHDRAALDPADRGTGLGLFISKGIAQQHGGRIDCASPGRGKGSTFTLWLPRLAAAATTAPG